MELYNYHTQQGYRTALIIKEARKLMDVMLIEDRGVLVKKVPLVEQRYMKPALYKGKPYTEARIKAGFRRAAKTLGANSAARKVIRSW